MNKKYDLLVCDCDFTLIDDKGYLSEENIDAIRQVMEMGVDFVIATGRNDVLAFDFAREIGGDIIVIGCNGATARNPATGEIYRNESIPEESLEMIVDYLDRNAAGYRAYTIDRAYSKGLDLGLKLKALTGKEYENYMDLDVFEIKDGGDIVGQKVLKVVAVEEKERLERIQRDLRSISGINAVFAGETVLDIISDRASKGAALKELMTKKGIKPERTIVFGDSENDLSMLRLAGLSVCMKNGDESVKRLCHKVTEYDNNSSGVGRMLKKIFDLR